MDLIPKTGGLMKVTNSVLWFRNYVSILAAVLLTATGGYYQAAHSQQFTPFTPFAIYFGGTHTHIQTPGPCDPPAQPQTPSGRVPPPQPATNPTSTVGSPPAQQAATSNDLPAINNLFAWKLAVQHTKSFCSKQNMICRENIPRGYTVHGLYAIDDTGASFPTSSDTYQIQDQEIEDLVPQLEDAWPQLRRGFSDMQFWIYEYSKHGQPTGLGPHAYFSIALRLKAKFDEIGVETLLHRSMIDQGTFFNLDVFCQAVTQVSVIKCCKNNELETQLLELQLCYDPHDEHFVPCSAHDICKKIDCAVPTLYPYH